jgi:hypothetical protein
MKTLNLNQLETIEAGGYFTGFCRGVQAATAVYGIAILVGMAASPAAPAAWTLAGINVACVFA